MGSTEKSIGVGLIGFGVAGRVFHAPVIRATAGLHLAAIVQRTGDTAAQAYPGVLVVRSMDALLALPDVRLVVVATPNASHADIARRCLEAGRDVVIDKPFATTSGEAQSLLDLAAQSHRLLSVYQNRRWDGDFLTLLRLLRDGACGRPVLFESHFDRYRPHPRPGSWRERAEPGGGLLFDLGSHLVDQAVTLFGVPEAITADVRIERNHAEADDAFEVLLHYPHMRALLRATMLACRPGPRFVLRGDTGTYVKYHLDPQEAALRQGDTPGAAGWGVEPRDRWGTLTRAVDGDTTEEAVATEPGDYRGYYENVRDAVAHRTPLAVTPAQALGVIRLLELARESSRLGRTLRVPFSSNP